MITQSSLIDFYTTIEVIKWITDSQYKNVIDLINLTKSNTLLHNHLLICLYSTSYIPADMHLAVVIVKLLSEPI